MKHCLLKRLNLKHVAVAVLLIYCIFESYLGISQLLGYRESNNSVYKMTASFTNPGPFGGFLAVCISIFIPYIADYKFVPDKRLFLKVLYWLTIIGTIFSFIVLPSTQSRSAILALGCSLLLFSARNERIRPGIIKVVKRYGIWLLAGMVIIGIGAYRFKRASADGRLFMDRMCIKAICTSGWKGSGLGYFGGAYGDTQYRFFRDQILAKGNDDLDWSVIDEHDRLTADCPDNAFNEYLFVGVEAGPFIMLLLICSIVVLIAISFKRGTMWCYGLTSLAVFAFFSYPFHVRQFQILFPVLIVGCLFEGAGRKSMFRLISEITVIIAATVVVVLKIPDYKEYKQAEAAWKLTEGLQSAELHDYVVESCDTLFPIMKNNIRFLFAYSQSLNKIGNYEKSDSILKIGAEKSSDPMFWNVMGNNSMAMGRYREAEERYKHAFYMVPNRLYPLYLLAKLSHTEGDTIRFLEMADRVESFIPKVESFNTERLRKEIRELKTGYLSLTVNE